MTVGPATETATGSSVGSAQCGPCLRQFRPRAVAGDAADGIVDVGAVLAQVHVEDAGVLADLAAVAELAGFAKGERERLVRGTEISVWSVSAAIASPSASRRTRPDPPPTHGPSRRLMAFAPTTWLRRCPSRVIDGLGPIPR